MASKKKPKIIAAADRAEARSRGETPIPDATVLDPPERTAIKRRVTFSKEIADSICTWIADGYSLRAFCRRDDAPSQSTIYRWLQDNEAFREQYARAREDQADTHADEIVYIADTEDDPQKARVRIDARKWIASKLKPKKYGERIANELSGPDGGPIETKETSDLEIARRIAFALGRAVGRKEGHKADGVST